jgi:hypothetical protein
MSQPAPSRFITTLASLGLLLVPLAVVAQYAWPDVWNNRLYQPLYRDEGDRHTPIITEGTYLPPVITTATTYTSADNPLILAATTQIPAGVTVTLEPGVTVVAPEFATLYVDGTLVVNGAAENPVTFGTNEQHADNKTWSGVVVGRTGHATLQHAAFDYASPSLSCLPGSTVTADAITTNHSLVGIFTASETCAITNSRLQATQYGVVARGVAATVTNTAISAGKKEILTTNYSLPTTN